MTKGVLVSPQQSNSLETGSGSAAPDKDTNLAFALASLDIGLTDLPEPPHYHVSNQVEQDNSSHEVVVFRKV